MTKRWTVRLALLFFIAGSGWTQSNQMVDALLEQDPAQLGHTTYLILSAAGIIPEAADAAVALVAAQERGWIPAGATAGDATTFGALAHLLMEAFEEEGGVMYRFFPGPRYAAREIAYQGWARRRRPPGERIGGEVVVRIVSVYLNSQGGSQ